MSETPAPKPHWIVRVLVFLLRLLVFALTGEWVHIGGEQGPDEEPPTPMSRPSAQKSFAKSLSVQDAVQAAERVLVRVEKAKTLARARTSGTALTAFIEDRIEVPVRQQLARGRDGDTRGLLSLPTLIQQADRTLSILEASLADRANASYGALVADAEAFASALAGPLYELGRDGEISVRERRFVGLSPAHNARAAAQAELSWVAPLPVSPTLREEPRLWALLAREVSSALLLDTPAIVSELRQQHRWLSPQLFLPPSASGYDPDTVITSLGVWLDELMADVMTTYLLGPSYVDVLAELSSSPKEPARAMTASAQGRFLSSEPPARVRLHAALLALESLGFHVEAKQLVERFDRVHGAPLMLFLPTATSELAQVPYNFVAAELEEILTFALREPTAALSGRSWLSLPGFAFLHAEQAQALAIRRRFLQGAPSEGSPRVLIAAAILAARDNPKARDRALKALLASIRGADTLEAGAGVHAGDVAGQRVSGVGLRAVLRERRALREAVIVGEAFARPSHSARR